MPPGCRSHFGPLSTCPGAARFLVCVLGVHVPSLLLRKLPVMGGAFVSLGGWCSLATPVLGCRTRKHFAQGVTLAPHRPALPSAQLASFFGALDSVLKYRATVTQAFRDMDRFTVNETVLSTKDVLILLHKWSLIGRDTALQEDLRAAIEKYQVKELLSECRDPGSPCGLPKLCSFPLEQAHHSLSSISKAGEAYIQCMSIFPALRREPGPGAACSRSASARGRPGKGGGLWQGLNGTVVTVMTLTVRC